MTLWEFRAEVWYATFHPIQFVYLKSLVVSYN